MRKKPICIIGIYTVTQRKQNHFAELDPTRGIRTKVSLMGGERKRCGQWIHIRLVVILMEKGYWDGFGANIAQSSGMCMASVEKWSELDKF
jgi:hypothetical protein